ncbi:hypothetical protein MMRN_32980 [Mycobacterium marinum]|nr:hypothetical protein MMRN_32980 [Mycobacterium marinum]
MGEWRAAAVERIVGLSPGGSWRSVSVRVVACPACPDCVEYWGTDFSASTIEMLQAAVVSRPWGDRVRLRVQPADSAEGLPAGHFDVVVLNSVIQYFPSAGYLLDAGGGDAVVGAGRGVVYR